MVFDKLVTLLVETLVVPTVVVEAKLLDEVEMELLELDEEEDEIGVSEVEVTGTTVLEKVVPLVLDWSRATKLPTPTATTMIETTRITITPVMALRAGASIIVTSYAVQGLYIESIRTKEIQPVHVWKSDKILK